MNINDSLIQILIAAGGASVVCGIIFASLWKMIMNALFEKFKHSQVEALEHLKNDLAQSTLRTSRYEGAQFGAYQEAWDLLIDLQLAADRLWDRATQRNVEEFGRHFEAIRKAVYGGKVYFDEPHQAALEGLVDEFREFYDGKQGLLALRRQHTPDNSAIAALIARNGKVRQRYSKVIDEVAVSYRDKMRGQAA